MVASLQGYQHHGVRLQDVSSDFDVLDGEVFEFNLDARPEPAIHRSGNLLCVNEAVLIDTIDDV